MTSLNMLLMCLKFPLLACRSIIVIAEASCRFLAGEDSCLPTQRMVLSSANHRRRDWNLATWKFVTDSAGIWDNNIESKKLFTANDANRFTGSGNDFRYVAGQPWNGRIEYISAQHRSTSVSRRSSPPVLSLLHRYCRSRNRIGPGSSCF